MRRFFFRLVSQRQSSSLIYKPSLICSYIKSRFLCQSFSSNKLTDREEDDKKGVREWEPHECLASKGRTHKKLGISKTQVQQTQSSAYEQKCIGKGISNLLRTLSVKNLKKSAKASLVKRDFPATVFQRRELTPSVWNFLEISSIIYSRIYITPHGMQGMSSDSNVCDLLSRLAIKIHLYKENLSVQDVGNALYGLQGINRISKNTDLILVITFLCIQVKNIVDKSLSSGPPAGTLSMVQPSSQPTIKPSSQPSMQPCTKDLVTLCQSLVLILPELGTIISTEKYKELRKMNVFLTNELALRRQKGDVYYKQLDFQSRAEKRMFGMVNKACRNKDIKIQLNSYLFDLFESDIILTIPSTDEYEEIIINIEVDGIHHIREKKKMTFCKRKDQYLKSKGVFVSRIDTFMMNDMKDIELEEWISQAISEASISSQISKQALNNSLKKGYIYNLIMFYFAGFRAPRPADDSLMDQLGDDEIVPQPRKHKRYFTDEQQKKININLRSRIRRKVKLDAKKKVRLLQFGAN